MVDARQMGNAAARHAVADELSVRIDAYDPTVALDYVAFCAGSLHGPHQSPHFVECWSRATEADLLMASVQAGGETVFQVPLEVVRNGPFLVARFPGGQHANGNFPPLKETPIETDALIRGLQSALRKSRGDIDVLALERLAPTLNGADNPLIRDASGTSPNVALSVRLDGGFEALLDRSSGKRKRKKHRSQLRKFEAAGGYRVLRTQDGASADALLDAFFAMKAERFAQMGIANVFAEPGCEAFMRALYRGGQRGFVMHGLEVGGTLRAVTGSSIAGDRMICDISAIATDDLTGTSPGDFLFHEMIREACERGLAVFDFSVGDEHYKRLWSDTETWQSDLFVPLTARGGAAVAVSRSVVAMKRAIKSNPLVWSLAKRLRKGVAGREAEPATADAD